jgi:hypothetical protein
MLPAKRVYFITGSTLVALAALVACESDSGDAPPPAGFDASIDVGQVDGSPGNPTDSGNPSDSASGDAGTDAASCTPGVLVQADGGPFLEPSSYFQASDSPFYCRQFAYYHLADFEGDGGLTPGLSATLGALAVAPGTLNPLIDSVDGDDGIADGGIDGATFPCERCNSWFNANGAQGVSFEFDGTVLGGLPTHAGLVWTDGTGPLTVTFTAYDVDGNAIGTQVVTPIGDSSNSGDTKEDRFFGIVHDAGVKRIFMSNSAGGIEVDHVQYGR